MNARPDAPTATESAMRGSPANVRAAAGASSMRDSSTCGRTASLRLNYAFIDTGDGARGLHHHDCRRHRVGCALIVEVKYQPPFWLHAVLWLPLILATHAAAIARDEVAFDRAAVSSQGSTWPADRSRSEMMEVQVRWRGVAGFGVFSCWVAVFVGLGSAVAAAGRKARIDRGLDRAPRGGTGIAAGADAMERTDARPGRIPPRQFCRAL